VGLTTETSISINSEIESQTTYEASPLLRVRNNHAPEEEEEEQGTAWG
jgi:hypothetical protein